MQLRLGARLHRLDRVRGAVTAAVRAGLRPGPLGRTRRARVRWPAPPTGPVRTASAAGPDLLALTSHAVNQPLSSCASLAELLDGDWDELADDARRELATKIHRNIRRVTEKTEQMLTVIRLDRGTLRATRTPTPLAELVTAVLARLDDPPGVHAEIDPRLIVLADPDLLRAAIWQLVSNALRHGRPPVEILAEQRPGVVLLAIRDSGDGLPRSVLRTLPVARYPATRPACPRPGRDTLGLYLARRLLELNGGALRYHPEPGGARMVLRLAPATRSGPARLSPDPRHRGGTGPTGPGSSAATSPAG